MNNDRLFFEYLAITLAAFWQAAICSATMCYLKYIKSAIPRFITMGLLGISPAVVSAQPWEPNRTPGGRPDLQGYWTNRTRTPLQRPAALGEQRAYSLDEAQQFEARLRQSAERSEAPSDPERGAPTGGDIGSYNTFWLDLGTNVIQIDGEYRTSMIIDPPDGRIPFKPENERAPSQLERWLAMPGVGPFDGPELQTIGERCLLFYDFRTSNSGSGPPMMPMYYNNNYQIIQTDSHVVILTEMIHDARIIPLRNEHTPVPYRWNGDSIGHWEGDTLVITTRNLHPQQSHFGSSDQLVVTERLQRVSDSVIEYSFTMDDPLVYRQPWTAQMTFNKLPEGEVVYEYACHEGNYSLTGILAGARRDDVAAELGEE
jgi:hypothetical protein